MIQINVKRFDFNHKANDKIRRTIELIQENNPELEIIEHSTEDYKFYQKDWFYLLMLFICCMPLGLFLMWYYKKGTKSMRIILTVLFITFMGHWDILIMATHLQLSHNTE